MQTTLHKITKIGYLLIGIGLTAALATLILGIPASHWLFSLVGILMLTGLFGGLILLLGVTLSIVFLMIKYKSTAIGKPFQHLLIAILGVITAIIVRMIINR